MLCKRTKSPRFQYFGVKTGGCGRGRCGGAEGTADEWGAARRANLAAGARGGCGRRAGWRMLLSAGAVRSKYKNKAAVRQPCSLSMLDSLKPIQFGFFGFLGFFFPK